MQIKQILRYQLVYVLLVILLVAAVIFNINTGNINISPARIFRIIFLKDYVGTPEYNKIIDSLYAVSEFPAIISMSSVFILFI